MTTTRMWVVQRSIQDPAGRWQTSNQTFGPSPHPPPDAVMYWRRSVQEPDWVPFSAQDWDVTGDREVYRLTGLEQPGVPPPPELRVAVTKWRARLAEPIPHEPYPTPDKPEWPGPVRPKPKQEQF